jgi:hypothetical protein
MLTDTDLVSRPCPCGNGEVETTISTPTQGPISSYSIRRAHRIKCADCDRQYVVDGNTIVSRTDLTAYRAANEQWSTAFRELNESPTAVEARTALAAMLATFRTKNAAHDYLTKAGLNDATYSSFIREYTGSGSTPAQTSMRPGFIRWTYPRCFVFSATIQVRSRKNCRPWRRSANRHPRSNW